MRVYGSDILVLQNKRIKVQLAEFAQTDLKFYLENPRLYTVVRADGKEPTQEEIEDTLATMDHVKVLVQSIKQNGGLTDAIIVQGGTYVVLEGNSRLAAYRILAKQDPVKWGKIKARVLPETIGQSEVFSLLGQYHIIGRKDWAPFEQAGYLYRRHKTHGISIPDLAKEIHLGKKAIAHLINVYEFMVQHGEEGNVNRWSYYDEFLKSNKIKKARKDHAGFDDLVVAKIKSEEIARAVDIRDGLRKIVEAGGKVLERFASGKKTFDVSVQAALDKGVGDQGVTRVRKFKEWLAKTGAQDEILELEGEARKECVYDLKKIDKLVSGLLKKLA